MKHLVLAAIVVLTAPCLPARCETPYLYPMDFVPHDDTVQAVAQREAVLQTKWRDHFAQLDAWIKEPAGKPLADFIKKQSSRDLFTLAEDYGYAPLRKPALEKARAEYLRLIARASKVLDGKGIRDIGDVADLNNAMREALVLKEGGAFSPDLSAPLERILTDHVENKAIFWGFTKKFPYYLSGYNKECITMEVGSNTKLLYHGAGKFPTTIDAFDAVWSQLSQHAYELDNAPHYDSSVNLHIVLRWGMLHGTIDELKAAPHFRMIFDRMAFMAMANGEHANFGKSMAVFKKVAGDGGTLDDLFVNGGGLGTMMRWAYRFYGDPTYLYIARKYEMTNSRGKGVLTFMPKAYDLNFFEVKNAMPRPEWPLCQCTIRLKGPGYALDRGVRREQIQPVQDKLFLSTGTHPQAASLLMDLSFTQSKAMANRRIGIDNHLFNGTHTVSIVGRPPEPERTNRIIISSTSASAGASEKTTYELYDYVATRVNRDLAYGEVEYATFQSQGVKARRRMALLHNGVLVVEDTIWSDAELAEEKDVKVLYNVWSDTVARGTNWVLSTPHAGHLPDGKPPEPSQVFVYVAPAAGQKPAIIDGRVHDTLQAAARLGKDKAVRIVSAVIPLPRSRAESSAAVLGKEMVTTVDERGTAVRIPYASGTTLCVRFPEARGSTAEYAWEGGTKRVAGKPSVRQASVNPPYATVFGNAQEWYVPNFKADFSLHETVIRSITCQGKVLQRDRDYTLVGPVLTLTKPFADRLVAEKYRGDLIVQPSEGKPVTLKLNADTTAGIRLANGRREKTYTNDEMMLPYGYRENTRMRASGGAYAVTFYDDWLYRGNATRVNVADGQTVKLSDSHYKSFRIQKLK